MDAHTDIDYFIITQPGRLWLSRTLLILYKKIFLLNSRKNFCVNYFVDSENLSIPDRNIFTATEAASLIPMYNATLYLELLRSNSWVQGYFPQLMQRDADCVRDRNPKLKSRLEKMFSGAVGERLDAACFRMTLGYWKRKFRHFDAATFDHRLRSRKNVSKHHPHSFQEKVLAAFEDRIRQFESRHVLSLH